MEADLVPFQTSIMVAGLFLGFHVGFGGLGFRVCGLGLRVFGFRAFGLPCWRNASLMPIGNYLQPPCGLELANFKLKEARGHKAGYGSGSP